MKKITCLTFVLTWMLVFHVFGQKPVIELTFKAQYQQQYVPIDSIYIENLTQGGDTMLFAPDTLLVLDYETGFVFNPDPGSQEFRIEQNIPNPFSEKTMICIFLPEKNRLEVSVFTLLGRKVASFENLLDVGIHAFLFYPGGEKNYILSASVSGLTKTIHMVNLTSRPGKSGSLDYQGTEQTQVGFKAMNEINDFGFSLGDLLRFTGYTLIPPDIVGSDVIEAIPDGSEIFIFEIAEGIPCPGTPTVTYEGQTYNTVQISTQCWMAENLNIGTMIQGTSSMMNDGVIEKYCFDNNTANCDEYGGLYQWEEMMQYVNQQSTQGICPPGWHLPSGSEWEIMVTYLGGGSVAGGKLKETDFIHWFAPNTGATNESGFTALPGGYRYINGNFYFQNNYGYFWTSELNAGQYTYARLLYYDGAMISSTYELKAEGRSVRCVKD